MGTRHFFEEPVTGNTIISTSNGEFLTELVEPNVTRSDFYIEFYSDSDANNSVTPTGGTITTLGSPLGRNYLLGSNSLIQANEVVFPHSDYNPPTFDGLATRYKMILQDITGATHCRAVIFRY